MFVRPQMYLLKEWIPALVSWVGALAKNWLVQNGGLGLFDRLSRWFLGN